jgi:hypothetical protein
MAATRQLGMAAVARIQLAIVSGAGIAKGMRSGSNARGAICDR